MCSNRMLNRKNMLFDIIPHLLEDFRTMTVCHLVLATRRTCFLKRNSFKKALGSEKKGSNIRQVLETEKESQPFTEEPHKE